MALSPVIEHLVLLLLALTDLQTNRLEKVSP
jgi:hypothetical protein